jgi:hypothetical protein
MRAGDKSAGTGQLDRIAGTGQLDRIAEKRQLEWKGRSRQVNHFRTAMTAQLGQDN